MNLSIKNVPEPVVQRLRERAKRHHRSLQGELLSIIEAAAREEPARDLTTFLADIKALGLRTACDSVETIRADRDSR